MLLGKYNYNRFLNKDLSEFVSKNIIDALRNVGFP